MFYTKRQLKLGIFTIIIILLAILVRYLGFTVIQEGNVGIKYRFGTIVSDALPSGLHITLPFIERIDVIDITEQAKDYQESCYTKDIQTVEAIAIKVNYQYDFAKLPYLIRNVGISNIENKIVKPQVESILKNEIGKYNGEELVSNRTVIQNSVEDQLRKNLISYGINIVSINIKNIDFDDAFEKVISEKVAAEQKLLTAKTEAEKLKVASQGNADAKKIEADAEAYSIKVVNDAIKALDSDAYVRLQWIQKWNGQLPTGVLDAGAVIYDLGNGHK